MSRIRLLLAVSACALVAVPAVAQARPHVPTFKHTYPHASKLCVAANTAHLPKRLQPVQAEVVAACATLHTSFGDAKKGFATTVKPLVVNAKTAVKTAVAACKAAHASHTKGVCRPAIKAALKTLKGIRQDVRSAVKTYRAAVDAGRKTFWATIKALPGGTVAPDAPSSDAPAADVPADSAVPAS